MLDISVDVKFDTICSSCGNRQWVIMCALCRSHPPDDRGSFVAFEAEPFIQQAIRWGVLRIACKLYGSGDCTFRQRSAIAAILSKLPGININIIDGKDRY